MRYILISILLLNSLNAKISDFSVIIDKPFNDALFDIAQDYDRQISAVGFTTKHKSKKKSFNNTFTNPFDYLESLSSANSSQMNLLKIDHAANITLNKTLNISTFSKAVSVIKTPSDGYFVGGYTLDGSLVVLKLNYNGDIIFSRKFGTANLDSMSSLKLLSDGGVLAIGSAITTRSKDDPLFQTGLGLNDIFITRFSKDGVKLWSKKYGTVDDDKAIDAVEAFDGSIMVLSSTENESHKNINLMRINENGNKVWLKVYDEKVDVTPYSITRLRDNNFLLSLSQKNDMNTEQVRLIKISMHKKTIVDKIIPTTYSSLLKSIKEYSNSNLIGVGSVRDTYNTDALQMQFDSELNLLCQEHYGEENYDMFNSVAILHNSKAAAVGINTSETSQESNMWIMKLNSDCTVAQKSTKEVDFYIALKRLFKDEIESNKLRIYEDMSIEFIYPELYFKVAEYILTKPQKEFLTKFSKKLIPFLYRYTEMIDTLEINGHTSSEWGNTSFTQTYLKNEKLSMNRSFSTLSYIFKKQDKTTQKWLSEILKGSGLSYSKKVMLYNSEDRDRSRRVSFKIILK